MTARDKHPYLAIFPELLLQRLSSPLFPESSVPAVDVYDPELLYVECHVCGKPVLWEAGKTTELLVAAGVDISTLDERCMIMSEGCPACNPGQADGYTLAVIRIAGLTPEEAVHMARPGGTA